MDANFPNRAAQDALAETIRIARVIARDAIAPSRSRRKPAEMPPPMRMSPRARTCSAARRPSPRSCTRAVYTCTASATASRSCSGPTMRRASRSLAPASWR